MHIQRIRSGLGILIILILCACSSKPPSPASKNEKPAEPKPTPEKEYSFVIQGGKTISASVFDASQKYGNGKKLVIFVPFVDKTDGNFYLASLEALWNIYGKQRGLFQLGDAQTEYISGIGGNAVFWYISNPRQRFGCLPIKDSETGRVAAIVVWVSDLAASEKIAMRRPSATTNTEPVKEVERSVKLERSNSAETARTEDTNVVRTNKGTPKMVEAEDNKSKPYRY